MEETIIELFDFQLLYLKRLVENIPENRLYENQVEGFNSAGWILAHLCIEAEDVFNYLNIPYEKLNTKWPNLLNNIRKNSSSFNQLPTKGELLAILEERYALLSNKYLELTDFERKSNHPSKMLRDIFSNVDSWFAHHLTTHIAIHCGNIVVLKKLLGIEINGF